MAGSPHGFTVTGDTGWATGAQRCMPIQMLRVGRLTDGSTTRQGRGDKVAVYAQTEPRLEPVWRWAQQQLAPLAREWLDPHPVVVERRSPEGRNRIGTGQGIDSAPVLERRVREHGFSNHDPAANAVE